MLRPSRHFHPSERFLVLCGTCAVNLSAGASPATSQTGYRWPDLLTEKVIACGVAAVALLVVSVLLRGFLKLISLAIVVVLAAGTFWFLRDAWAHRAELLPREWVLLADRTLQSRGARAAWRSLQAELPRLTLGVRRHVLTMLDAKAEALGKAGHKTDAAELMKLRDALAAEK